MRVGCIGLGCFVAVAVCFAVDSFSAVPESGDVPRAIAAGSSISEKEPVRLIVTLAKSNGELLCCLEGKESVSLEGLGVEVRSFLKANPDMVVVVRAGDGIIFEDIRRVMKVCANEKAYKMILGSKETIEGDKSADKEKPADGGDHASADY